MINYFLKYKKIFIFYLIGFAFSISSSYFLYVKNTFKLTNAGNFVDATYKLNNKFLEQVKKMQIDKQNFSVYLNFFDIDDATPSFYFKLSDILDNLNQANSDYEISVNEYMYDKFPMTQFSTEYKNYYGVLYLSKEEDSILLTMPAKNEEDLKNYKLILNQSIKNLFINLSLLESKNLLLTRKQLINKSSINKEINGKILGNFSNDNISFEDYIKINLFFIDEYLNYMKDSVQEITSIDAILSSKAKFRSEKNLSIFYIFPLIIFMIQSFFILLYRIINDSKK